jgi:hypothetical protein
MRRPLCASVAAAALRTPDATGEVAESPVTFDEIRLQ